MALRLRAGVVQDRDLPAAQQLPSVPEEALRQGQPVGLQVDLGELRHHQASPGVLPRELLRVALQERLQPGLRRVEVAPINELLGGGKVGAVRNLFEEGVGSPNGGSLLVGGQTPRPFRRLGRDVVVLRQGVRTAVPARAAEPVAEAAREDGEVFRHVVQLCVLVLPLRDVRAPQGLRHLVVALQREVSGPQRVVEQALHPLVHRGHPATALLSNDLRLKVVRT
mmetsp:Transcript_4145/g.14805  ORF Transcript_4145/g.14805 Transcript_4145/m.14805 type:complete len:224 (+) Transcript_4145:1262-1933(+)